ncbi:MAG: tetratricopeptide repeat protein, partial [Melioribacteraceae bacterium]
KLRSALTHAKAAVEIEPKNTDYNFLLARVYTSAHQTDSAIATYERLISFDSTNYQAYYNLAYLYESEKPTQALSLYNKLIDMLGPQWSVLVKIADLNERMGNVEETIKSVENLLELNPSNLDLQKILIESYLKSGKYDKAISRLDETLAIYPEDENLIEYKASAYIQTGKWKEGAEEYTKLIDNEKISFDAKLRIGIAFFTQSGKDSSLISVAKNIFEKIDKDSLDYQVKVYLGEIAALQNDDSTAIQNFKIASTLAEWNPQVWMRLGGMLFESQKYYETEKEMRKAVANFPDDFVLNIYLGLSLSQQTKHEEAIPYLKKSVGLQPNDLTALSAYGFSLFQLNREDEALTYLEKAYEIAPENMTILGMLGLIYDNKELTEKSDAIYEKALAVDSTDISILNNYAYSLSERGIRLNEALEMVKKSVEADPENSSYLDTIGWVYYQLGEYEKAKSYIEKAIQSDAGNATQYDHLGDVYLKLGNRIKAVEAWN